MTHDYNYNNEIVSKKIYNAIYQVKKVTHTFAFGASTLPSVQCGLVVALLEGRP